MVNRAVFYVSIRSYSRFFPCVIGSKCNVVFNYKEIKADRCRHCE
ncbi:hypothetical protein B4135_1003 [Caldibacillus debilis]|uniref:Uncharacterized protein n=1 Tax=Caldibacillus debilis TaxID=301148 RepID=A0A150MF77_9BACI|nr:hypothetical protein B4135_1003 [Caldibacillus debilis]